MALPPMMPSHPWGLFVVIRLLVKGDMPLKKSKQQSRAQKLLLEYRPTIWRKAMLETIPGTSEKALLACTEQIRITQELAQTLRLWGNKQLGEKLYWIIYVSYLTEQQPTNIEKTLTDIAAMYEHIPRRTLFRLKGRAISMMDDILNQMV